MLLRKKPFLHIFKVVSKFLNFLGNVFLGNCETEAILYSKDLKAPTFGDRDSATPLVTPSVENSEQ